MKSSFYLDHVFKAQSHSEILEVEALPWLCLNLSPNSGDRPPGQVAEGTGDWGPQPLAGRLYSVHLASFPFPSRFSTSPFCCLLADLALPLRVSCVVHRAEQKGSESLGFIQ